MFLLHIHRLKQDVETITNVESLQFTSTLGVCEILTNHEPFFTTFLPGEIVIREGVETSRHIACQDTGFLKMENNVCDVWIL